MQYFTTTIKECFTNMAHDLFDSYPDANIDAAVQDYVETVNHKFFAIGALRTLNEDGSIVDWENYERFERGGFRRPTDEQVERVLANISVLTMLERHEDDK